MHLCGKLNRARSNWMNTPRPGLAANALAMRSVPGSTVALEIEMEADAENLAFYLYPF